MDWNTLAQEVEKLYDQLHEISRAYYHLWRESILFSWRWWIALLLIIGPWTLWILVRKKESTARLLLAGAIVAIIASFLDFLGVSLNLWSYPTTVFPLMPSYVPFDLSAMPVSAMLWLQFFPRMKLVWKAPIYGAVGSFLFEPFCDRIGLVIQHGWSYLYSFALLNLIYLLAYFVATRNSFQPFKE